MSQSLGAKGVDFEKGNVEAKGIRSSVDRISCELIISGVRKSVHFYKSYIFTVDKED